MGYSFYKATLSKEMGLNIISITGIYLVALFLTVNVRSPIISL